MIKNKKWTKLPVQSLGDVIDRVTILSRKIFFGEEEAYKEHTYLTEAIEDLGITMTGALVSAIIRLTQMNIEIWNRENLLRRAPEGELPAGMTPAQVAHATVEIRDFNRKRVKYKNEINRLTGLGFREFKIKHRSQ